MDRNPPLPDFETVVFAAQIYALARDRDRAFAALNAATVEVDRLSDALDFDGFVLAREYQNACVNRYNLAERALTKALL